MSDENKKDKELDKELLDQEVAGDDFLDDLVDIDSDGIDDFLSDDNLEESNDSEDEIEEETKSFASVKDSDPEDNSDTEIESLDNEIAELDEELKGLNESEPSQENRAKEPVVDSDETDEDEGSPDGKKSFKLSKFHMIAGAVAMVIAVGGMMKITSGPTPDPAHVTQEPVNLESKTKEVADASDMVKETEVEGSKVIVMDDFVDDLSKAGTKKDSGKTQEDNEVKDNIVSEAIKNEELTLTTEPEEDLFIEIKSKSALSEIINERSKADGLSIKTLTKDGDIVLIQDQMENIKTVSVGDFVNYYGRNIRIDNILDGGNIILLSEGLYMDSERQPVNAKKYSEIQDKKAQELAAAKLAKQKEEAEKQQMMDAALEMQKAEISQQFSSKIESLKAKLANLEKEKRSNTTINKEPVASQGTLTQAIDRIQTIESKLNNPKKPELLTGWSINANFKEKREGYILNGYLIKNTHGEFFKVVVGDSFENYGIVKGYDDNGKFFIGNYYIL